MADPAALRLGIAALLYTTVLASIVALRRPRLDPRVRADDRRARQRPRARAVPRAWGAALTLILLVMALNLLPRSVARLGSAKHLS